MLIQLLEFCGGVIDIVLWRVDLPLPDGLATTLAFVREGGGYPPVIAVGHDAKVVSVGDDVVAYVKGWSRRGDGGLFIEDLFY